MSARTVLVQVSPRTAPGDPQWRHALEVAGVDVRLAAGRPGRRAGRATAKFDLTIAAYTGST